MWHIIKNEWIGLHRNRAFLGLSTGFMMVLLLTVVLGTLQTHLQQRQYESAKNEVRQQWENLNPMNPHGAAHYGTYVFKPNSLLGSLDEGVNGVTGKVLRVEGHVQNEIVHSEASQMQAVSKFGKLKSALLLQYILPLLLLFVAFRSVNSEKQSGRLKLLVLQGGQLQRLVWAKVLAVWLYGMALLLLTLVAYALASSSSIDANTALRVLFFFLSYGLFYFIISGLTVLLSTLGKNATIALTTMLGIWILWTIFLPNILMSTVDQWHELPSREAFKTAMKADRSKGIDGHNPSDERSKELKEQTLKKYGVEEVSQLPINFDGLRMQADEAYGNRVWDKHFGRLREILAHQKQDYQLAGVLNPFISLQNASMGFAGSDNYHHQEFLVRVELYRRDFIKTLNDKHAYGGSTTGDWQWKVDQGFFKSVSDFVYQPVRLSAVISHYFLDLVLLLAWSALVSLLLIFATRKMPLL
ncbi:MAG: ABC transporter permease [Salibacteraceae bacterium]